MQKIFFLKFLNESAGEYFFAITDSKENHNYQKVLFTPEDDELQFLPVKKDFSEYLIKKEILLKKIIRSRLLLDNSDSGFLPISFPERNVSETAPENVPEIYTDGSLSQWGNGGWAYILRFQNPDSFNIFTGWEKNSDSCRMELKAVVKALECSGINEIAVNTDSRYVKHGVEAWLPNWEINGYMTAMNKPAKNSDLWKRMSKLLKEKKIYWKWIKSHSGNYYHDLCHNHAKQEADLKRE